MTANASDSEFSTGEKCRITYNKEAIPDKTIIWTHIMRRMCFGTNVLITMKKNPIIAQMGAKFAKYIIIISFDVH